MNENKVSGMHLAVVYDAKMSRSIKAVFKDFCLSRGLIFKERNELHSTILHTNG